MVDLPKAHRKNIAELVEILKENPHSQEKF